MTLTARLATILRVSGASRSSATHAAVKPAAALTSKSIGARLATLSCSGLPLVLIAVLAVFVFAISSQALATEGHAFAGSFGGPGAADGQFNGGPAGVGVGLAGDVYTSEQDSGSDGAQHPRAQRFNGAGVFQLTFPAEALNEPSGVAVDSAPTGGVYVTAVNPGTGAPEVAKYSAAGVFEYFLNEAGSETTITRTGALAIDPSNGTVYTIAMNVNSGASVIDSFDQKTGAFIASFTGETGSPDGGFPCPSGLAVDALHNVYVLDQCKVRVDRYSSTGVYESTVDDGSRGAPQAVATNPETAEVYVAESGVSGLQVTNFTAAGTSAITTFPATNDQGLSGLAVAPDGTVYTGDRTSAVVDRFTSFAGPTVTSAAASEIQTTAATLNGAIDPEGVASKYHYEYGLEPTYGSSTEPVDAGSGSTANPAPAAITSLIPNTAYHYRIVGSNASGSILGPDEAFTTVAAPPHVDGSPAFVSAITPTGAGIHATVDPEHSPTTFRIEYGTTTAYGSTAPEVGGEVGEQSVDTPVSATLTGLEPGTLYHFRLSAENGVEGSQTGADGTFTTAPAAPATGAELTTRKATLTGTIDPHGAATTYHFNYGPGGSYGASTPEMNAGSGNGEELVTEHIAGLSSGTTYHVQVVATTNGVTRSGADGTFTTPPAPTPAVSDPTAVTTGSATLEGIADTHGFAGSYHFEVSALAGSFTASSEEQPLPATTGAQPVSVPIAGLPPGQTLQVRLVVTSDEATSYSGERSFATAPLPAESFPPLPSAGSLYGCIAPRLDAYNPRPKPGTTINITGFDLGLGGNVLLGEETLSPTNWTPTGFTVEVPADAAGTLGLTVNCGVASNTVVIAVDHQVSNAFTARKASVKGTTATLSLTLPGPGRLQAGGGRTRVTTTTVASGTHTIQVKLSSSGVRALAKSKRRTLTVRVQFRFTPTGGQPSTRTVTLTFKRKSGH